MNLDRARADVERRRDFLRVKSFPDQFQDFTLAIGQLRQFQRLIVARFRMLDSPGFLVEPLFNRQPQLRFVKGLFDEIHGFRLECGAGRFHVPVSGDDHKRQFLAPRAKILLAVQVRSFPEA